MVPLVENEVEASAEGGAENMGDGRGWQGEQIDKGLQEGLLLLGDVLGRRGRQERFAADEPLQQRERLLLGREGHQVVEVECLGQRRVSPRHPFLRRVRSLAAAASAGVRPFTWRPQIPSAAHAKNI